MDIYILSFFLYNVSCSIMLGSENILQVHLNQTNTKHTTETPTTILTLKTRKMAFYVYTKQWGCRILQLPAKA